jgi:hypothetical protein
METSYCPRCDASFTADTRAQADANVRDHLVRAIGADLDDGLHDFALEQWDSQFPEGS